MTGTDRAGGDRANDTLRAAVQDAIFQAMFGPMNAADPWLRCGQAADAALAAAVPAPDEDSRERFALTAQRMAEEAVGVLPYKIRDRSFWRGVYDAAAAVSPDECTAAEVTCGRPLPCPLHPAPDVPGEDGAQRDGRKQDREPPVPDLCPQGCGGTRAVHHVTCALAAPAAPGSDTEGTQR